MQEISGLNLERDWITWSTGLYFAV